MSSIQIPRVLIADDHVFLAECCKKLLEPEFEVAGIFADGRALLDAVPALEPDVIVLDVSMPVMNGLEAGKRIKSLMPSVKIVYLTMNDDLIVAADAFRIGASGYLSKSSTTSELMIAVRKGLNGESYLSPLLTHDADAFFLEVRASDFREEVLTVRQREVLQLLAEGRSNKEIARLLHLIPRTVWFHKYAIMKRLQVNTMAGLVNYAMLERMIS
jgi:DNA-binding NarL/FixJ family response regulator